MRLYNAVGVVSGGASGLGEAVVRAMIESGARAVAVLDPDLERGRALVDELGSACTAYGVDVSDQDSVAAAVDSFRDATGRIDVAVSAAGIAGPKKLLSRRGPIDMASFDRVVRVNLYGAVHLMRAAAWAMKDQEPMSGERGLLLNVASTAAFEGQIGQVAYAASKAALVGMTLPLARELGEYGIRVVTIAPGAFETPIWSQVPDATRRGLEALVPFPQRLGQPQEFASFALEIMRNVMHNGRTYRLDAGLSMPASTDSA